MIGFESGSPRTRKCGNIHRELNVLGLWPCVWPVLSLLVSPVVWLIVIGKSCYSQRKERRRSGGWAVAVVAPGKWWRGAAGRDPKARGQGRLLEYARHIQGHGTHVRPLHTEGGNGLVKGLVRVLRTTCGLDG